MSNKDAEVQAKNDFFDWFVFYGSVGKCGQSYGRKGIKKEQS
jgi:hypothetical protein